MLRATGKLALSVDEVVALFRRLVMPGVKRALAENKPAGHTNEQVFLLVSKSINRV